MKQAFTELTDEQINELDEVLASARNIIDAQKTQFVIISTIMVPEDSRSDAKHILKAGLLTGKEAVKAHNYIYDLIVKEEKKEQAA